MSVNGRYDFDRISLDDIASEASRWGLSHDLGLTLATELAGETSAALGDVITDDELGTRSAERVDRLLART